MYAFSAARSSTDAAPVVLTPKLTHPASETTRRTTSAEAVRTPETVLTSGTPYRAAVIPNPNPGKFSILLYTRAITQKTPTPRWVCRKSGEREASMCGSPRARSAPDPQATAYLSSAGRAGQARDDPLPIQPAACTADNWTQACPSAGTA